MAKLARPKLSPEQRLHKSLVAAARILNKKMHLPLAVRNIAFADGNREEVLALQVVIHQVWCNDENAPVGKPTTDDGTAETIRDTHEEATGHSCKIIDTAH